MTCPDCVLEHKANRSHEVYLMLSFTLLLLSFFWGVGSDSSKLIGCERHFPFKEGWGEGKVREFGIEIYTLLYLKWITNKDLLSSTGSSAACHVAAWMGGGCRGQGYVAVSLCCPPETVTVLIGHVPIPNTKLKQITSPNEKTTTKPSQGEKSTGYPWSFQDQEFGIVAETFFR